MKSATVPRRSSQRRQPGRPVTGSADHREALLDAGIRCFAAQGVAAATLKRIAADAGVTPALAHYYFRDKEGLLDAVVELRIAPLVQTLATAVREIPTAQPRLALETFVREYTALASSQPWLPQLLVREVLNPQGALRTRFPQRFAAGLATLLTGVIRTAQQRGEILDSLDPARLVMSIIALCIFPFIATPLVVDTLGIAVGPEQAQSLASHHLAVLLSGIEVRS